MINASQIARAQSCPNEPQGGGEGISASASINGTIQLTDGGFVSAGTNVRLDSIATAGGACVGMAWYCQQTPCTCEATGYVYQRTINHTNVYVDVTSSGALNGTYFVGTVQFQNAYEHTLDSGAANTSGPNYFTLSSPGSYTFRFQGIINTTPCNIQPGQTAWTTITLNAHPNDAAKDSGEPSCRKLLSRSRNTR